MRVQGAPQTSVGRHMITESLYNSLFVSGNLPGILYGLPKVHKTGIPICPNFFFFFF